MVEIPPTFEIFERDRLVYSIDETYQIWSTL